MHPDHFCWVQAVLERRHRDADHVAALGRVEQRIIFRSFDPLDGLDGHANLAARRRYPEFVVIAVTSAGQALTLLVLVVVIDVSATPGHHARRDCGETTKDGADASEQFTRL